eukprot:XP_022280756.1 uncharacterized protein LOC111097970 [Canis lupus familiaris]
MVPDRPMVDSQLQVLLGLLGDKCVFGRKSVFKSRKHLQVTFFSSKQIDKIDQRVKLEKCQTRQKGTARPGLQVQRPPEAAGKEAEGGGRGGGGARARPAGPPRAGRAAPGIPALRRAPRGSPGRSHPSRKRTAQQTRGFATNEQLSPSRPSGRRVFSKQRTPARPKGSLSLKEQKPPGAFKGHLGGHVSSEKFRRIKVLEGAPGRGNGNTETFQRLTQFPDLTPLLTVITAPLSLTPQLYHEDNHSSHSRGVW